MRSALSTLNFQSSNVDLERRGMCHCDDSGHDVVMVGEDGSGDGC